MKTILCVEDNPEIQILVEAALDQQQVTMAKTLAEAKGALKKQTFDLVILDLELPDGDGMKFLAEIGQEHQTPVFILTGRTETANKVIAFSLGVDDFISKPFDPLELRARVNAKLKKTATQQDQQAVLKMKDLTIDVEKQRVSIAKAQGGESVSLTSIEFRLLLTFARSPDRVFSRAQLLDKVWGSDIAVTDRTVDTHVGHLRKKISSSNVKIETVLNEGYRLLI
jgi:two-component system phosphate regulon response regulator PhoB